MMRQFIPTVVEKKDFLPHLLIWNIEEVLAVVAFLANRHHKGQRPQLHIIGAGQCHPRLFDKACFIPFGVPVLSIQRFFNDIRVL